MMTMKTRDTNCYRKKVLRVVSNSGYLERVAFINMNRKENI